MTKEVIVQTKGGPLTEDDFETEAQSPGASNKRYSAQARKGFDDLLEEIRAGIKRKGEV